MKVTTEPLEGREVRLEIQLSEDELERAMQEAARRISREVQIPGFRKGKAPYAAVVRVAGKEALREEALDSLLPKLYEQALQEAQITPYDQGVLEEVSRSDPPVLKIRVPLEPLVELGDYRSLRVEWQEPSVSEEEVQKALEEIASNYASWEPKDGPIAEGDRVQVDLEGHAEDGEPVFDHKHQSLVVRLESLYPVPGFHQELLGLQVGDTKEFTLPFPEDSSNKRLAGKPIRFRVTVREVMRRSQPLLDDNLAKLEGEYETLEDLRKAVRERLLQERREKAEEEYEAKVLKALKEMSRLELPAVALERELDEMLESQEKRLEEGGLNMETYLSMLKTTPEAYRQALRPEAEEQVVTRLLLLKVAEAEGLEPTTEEKINLLRQWLATGGEKADEDAESLLQDEVVQNSVRYLLRQRKALERLVRLARGEPLEEPAAQSPEAGPLADSSSPVPAGGGAVPLGEGSEPHPPGVEPGTME
ncbi:MAG: trigger factor [Anaerolineae bacterium]